MCWGNRFLLYVYIRKLIGVGVATALSVQFISMTHTGVRSSCDESVRYAIFNDCVVSVSEATKKKIKQNLEKENNYQDMDNVQNEIWVKRKLFIAFIHYEKEPLCMG